MVDTAHSDPEMMEEHRDPPDVLHEKVSKLAELVVNSSHFVAFTGAGISTNAGIPDFRGPQGKWTRLAKGLEPIKGVGVVEAYPTLAHMCLVELHSRGILKHLISTNCDGMHRRSGFPASALSEVHGNSWLEICEDCGQQYCRDFECVRIAANGKGFDHFTGRLCADCGGRLLNSTIDFGQRLPEETLRKSNAHSSKADLLLTLGSSLLVSSHIAAETVHHGGSLVICNLQKTPLSDRCRFQIFGDTDTVMSMLAEKLEMAVPRFRLFRRVLLSVSEDNDRVTLKTVDFHDPTSEIGFVCAIDWDGQGKRVQVIGKGSIAEAAAANGTHSTAAADLDLASVNPTLYFMGHYSEPPVTLSVNCMEAGPNSINDIRLAYDPTEAAWTLVSQEILLRKIIVSRGRDNTYGKNHWQYCVDAMMKHHKCDRKAAEARVNQRKEEGFNKAKEKGLMVTAGPSSRARSLARSSGTYPRSSRAHGVQTGRPKSAPRRPQPCSSECLAKLKASPT